MKVNIKEGLKYNDGKRRFPVKCKKCGTFYNTGKQFQHCTTCEHRSEEQLIARS